MRGIFIIGLLLAGQVFISGCVDPIGFFIGEREPLSATDVWQIKLLRKDREICDNIVDKAYPFSGGKYEENSEIIDRRIILRNSCMEENDQHTGGDK